MFITLHFAINQRFIIMLKKLLCLFILFYQPITGYSDTSNSKQNATINLDLNYENILDDNNIAIDDKTDFLDDSDFFDKDLEELIKARQDNLLQDLNQMEQQQPEITLKQKLQFLLTYLKIKTKEAKDQTMQHVSRNKKTYVAASAGVLASAALIIYFLCHKK